MTIIENAIHEIKRLRVDDGWNRLSTREACVLDVLEEACLESADAGYLRGLADGLQEARDNPFAE